MALAVQSVVEDILALVGIAEDGGGGPPPEFQARAVRVLNQLLGEWSVNLAINPKQTTISVTPSLSDRIIIGTDTTTDPPPDIVMNPMEIESLVIENGPVVYNASKISLAEYEGLSIKTIVAIPRLWAFDYQQPNANIWLYPRPFAGLTIRITATQNIADAVSQSTLDLPDYYYKALVYNGAAMLYPYYPRDAGIDQEIIYQAKSSLGAIKARNRRMRMSRTSTPYASPARCQSLWTSPMSPPLGGN